MRDIMKTVGADVSAPKRTPLWFLEIYIRHYAQTYRTTQRINFLEAVESSDDASSVMPELPDTQTHKLRHLRVVHRNEVWSIFASHSKWILSLVEKHKDLKGQVNTQSWRLFHYETQKLRQTAMRDEDTAGKWGLIDEQESKTTVTGKIPIPNVSASSLSVVTPQLPAPKGQKHKKKCTTTKV
jgi:hypothetical protein